MAFTGNLPMKVFSPRMMTRALATLDKSTAIVVSACWLAAFVMMILAIMAVHGAVSSKKDAAGALASEPVLPLATNTPMNPHEAQMILDRLQHQFPDIKFDSENGQAIIVKTTDGAKFHQWVTALSYIDTMAPEFRWTLRDFCVGSCNSTDLMRAAVIGQRVVFSLPSR